MAINQGDVIGSVELALDFLRDQLMHDLWVEVTDKGKILPGKLHVTVQWIHSNKTYHADLLVRLKEKIRGDQGEIQQLEFLLQRLHEPHGLLLHLDISTLTALPEESEPRPSVAVMNPSVIAEMPDPPYLDSLRSLFRKHSLVWMGLLVVAGICNVIKMDLINLCIAIAGLCYEILIRSTEADGKSRALIFMLLGACIHDLLWFLMIGYVLSHAMQ